MCTSLPARIMRVGGGEEEVTPTRGTRQPYVTYEAESQSCKGTVLGPDYRAYTDDIHLAAEASMRMACQLSPSTAGGSADSLSFTLRAPTNALRIRYSIPDAPKGGGTHDMMLVKVGAELHH
eukprot:gene25777-32065_t